MLQYENQEAEIGTRIRLWGVAFGKLFFILNSRLTEMEEEKGVLCPTMDDRPWLKQKKNRLDFRNACQQALSCLYLFL